MLKVLQELLPAAWSEGHLDFDALKFLLRDESAPSDERYRLTWAGKREAIQILQMPSRATLNPSEKESANFKTTENLFIEGDNLEVLKLLYKPYFSRIKMIYIDPPYNTGKDFVYPDNYADPLNAYLQLTGQKDAEGNLLTTNPETGGRFHSSWLNMMYPRLSLARQLLTEDGVIFVSIDDHELHNLRMIMNEIFGEENFIECFVWKKSYGGGAKEKFAVSQHEYILLFARNAQHIDPFWLPPDPELEARYYKYKDDKFEERGPYRFQPLEAAKSMDRRENLIYGIPVPGGAEVWPKKQWIWRKERALKALEDDELVFTQKGDDIVVAYKQYLRGKAGEERGAKPFSIIENIYTQHGTDDLAKLFDGERVLQFPKPVALMKLLLQFATDSLDHNIIVDFFAGSCSLAQAVLELNNEDGGNRTFIMAQLPEPTPEDSVARKQGFETIAEIGKERIRRVITRLQGEQDAKLKLSPDAPQDLGVKVFSLAKSNYRTWSGVEDAEAVAYANQMELFVDPLIEGWKPESVISEVALKEGYDLNSEIERVKGIKGNTVFRIHDRERGQTLYICLDDALKKDVVTHSELDETDLFVCRDVALTDELAANLSLQCRLKSI